MIDQADTTTNATKGNIHRLANKGIAARPLTDVAAATLGHGRATRQIERGAGTGRFPRSQSINVEICKDNLRDPCRIEAAQLSAKLDVFEVVHAIPLLAA